ncbi:MAG TPA: phytanoyl-CoA dioxygenase, partial [Thermoanaerobaculia bacterium]|nr:phytanoyl-CoA dioxygenase [Thermoanaerobaculia bacterium]
RLPYLHARDVGIAPRESLFDFYNAYRTKYEPAIQEVIRTEGLQAATFTPKKGDMLVWHANLLHAGSPRANRKLTRKSIVSHYFAEKTVCYHDLSAGLAKKD